MKALTLFNVFIQKDETNTMVMNSETIKDRFTSIIIHLSQDKQTWTVVVSKKKIVLQETFVENQEWYHFHGPQTQKVKNFLLTFNEFFEDAEMYKLEKNLAE